MKKNYFEVAVIFGLIFLVMRGCPPSQNQNESYERLDVEHKTLADICMARTGTKGHDQILITSADNPITKTKRILLNYTSEEFIRCDFSDKKFISAEKIDNGQLVKTY